MSLINHEELKKQLASGEITSLDDINDLFEVIEERTLSGSIIITALC